jgi:hypothetical protein
VIKRALTLLLISSGCCHAAFAGPLAGTFFNVASSGPASPIAMIICLNGLGPLSCQNYTAPATNLTITSNIPNHTYPNAGIKITTPGYTLAGCTMNSNGYCLFSVSNTQAATIQAAPSTCQAGTVQFTPTVSQVNNPTGGTPTAPQQVTVSMSMCNSLGQPIFPTAANPIHVDVYGAPTGAITPTSTTSTTGSVTFTYSGQSFPNNISINAWMSDSTNNGAALGVTQILKQNTPPSCTLGGNFYDVPLAGTLPGALQVTADVGYLQGSVTNNYKTYTIDTGSLGVVVPLSDLPTNANVIGPGPVGVKYYDSSGNTYAGNYYLAPVRIQTLSGTVQTQTIMVLAIKQAYCSGPTTKSCYTGSGPTPNLHYIGVGFNRDGTTGGDLFTSPVYNAFLHITNANNGTDVTPGYYLTPNDNAAPTGLRLGISSNTGYTPVNLSPNPAVPGDFLPQSGCFSFPPASPNQFCGTALLDVGIDYMFIDLPRAQWPAGTHNSSDQVPAGVSMQIVMGGTTLAAPLQYPFTTVLPPTTPPTDGTPTQVQWIDNPTIFVNTGRRPLYIYNYLYNGQCGQVAFKHL